MVSSLNFLRRSQGLTLGIEMAIHVVLLGDYLVGGNRLFGGGKHSAYASPHFCLGWRGEEFAYRDFFVEANLLSFVTYIDIYNCRAKQSYK